MSIFSDAAKIASHTVESLTSTPLDANKFISDKRTEPSLNEKDERAVENTVAELVKILDSQDSTTARLKKYNDMTTEYRQALDHFHHRFHQFSGIRLDSICRNRLDTPEDFLTHEGGSRSLQDIAYGDKYLGELLNNPNTDSNSVIKTFDCLVGVHRRNRDVENLFEEQRTKIENSLKKLAKSIGLPEDMIRVRVAPGSRSHHLYRGTDIITLPAEELLGSSNPEVRRQIISRCLENVNAIKLQKEIAHAIVDARSRHTRSRIGATSDDLPDLAREYAQAIGVLPRREHLEFMQKVLAQRDGKSLPRDQQETAMQTAERLRDFHQGLLKDRSQQIQEFSKREMFKENNENFALMVCFHDLKKMVQSTGCRTYFEAARKVFGPKRISEPLRELLELADRITVDRLTSAQQKELTRLVSQLAHEDFTRLNEAMREINERTFDTGFNKPVRQVVDTTVKKLTPQVAPLTSLPDVAIVETTNNAKPGTVGTTSIEDFFRNAGKTATDVAPSESATPTQQTGTTREQIIKPSEENRSKLSFVAEPRSSFAPHPLTPQELDSARPSSTKAERDKPSTVIPVKPDRVLTR
ncbi:MAG: hypothetical protein K2Z81_06240, partial [Cyanobacteria bacterium]|nr:hypothetical protein [Cyanobacteriota bacterium]